MRLTLTNTVGDIHSIDVDASLKVNDIKALIENEMKITVSDQALYHNNVEIKDGDKSLKESGIGQDDIILVRQNPKTNGTDQAAEIVRRQIVGTPALLQRLTQTQPRVAQAALNNPQEFARLYNEMLAQQRVAEQARQEVGGLYDADPFDVEAQKKIEEAIRQEQIQQNMELALEHNPEAFGRVHMLYIDVEVNGHPVKAFVDSGAQTTIMSPDCAEACGIMRLVDTRFAGVAMGVGTAKILGRIHSARLKIGSMHVPCSFTIMEGKGVDFLFGLDMLKRHQAMIDLKDNCLRLYDEIVPFLPEHLLPEKARDIEAPEPSPPKPSDRPLTTPQSAPVPQSAPQAASSRPVAQPTQPGVPEEAIARLQELGASREEALQALRAAGGNVDAAAAILFNF